MSVDYKQQSVDFLKSVETGDPKPAAIAGRYKQHNLALSDGIAGLQAAVKQLPPGSGKVNTVRVFQDGDYVFTHTDYNFFGPKIGFDVFHYVDGKIDEHWDNLQETPATPNPSGHAMIDGATQITDLGKTEANKKLVQAFVDDIFVNGRMDKFSSYFNGDNYIQHNPQIADKPSGLVAGLQYLAKQGIAVKYERIHKVLGEGNFVLVVGEGNFGGRHTAFYDLFRVENGKLAEHWDTLETIPPRTEWKNGNGKF
ncbi:MAG: nuclear transport factor 2 family protein [Gammaproteobacteria bacterium]|nr:nuclear transport factor 2 family protein [Gammaproteobacteria bacterium]